jgi:outer membrane immunogenic protein
MKLGKISNALLLGASAVAFSTLANAADIEVVAPDWTGLHVGVGAGYGMIDHDISASLDSSVFGQQVDVGLDGIAGEGALGTIEAGYDFQFNGNLLFGVQGDYTRSSIATKLDAGSGALTYKLEATDTVNLLARGGHIVDDSTLMYVIGGWTKTWFNGDLSFLGNPLSYDFEKSGWTIGGGVETAIGKNMTAKFEYRTTFYDTIEIFNQPDFLSVNSDSIEQTARAVLSYHGGNVQAYESGFETANWTGLHVGLAGGFGLVNHELSIDPSFFPATFSGVGGKGFVGSVAAGFDYQASERFVVGLQGDYTRSNVSTDIDGSFGLAPVGSYSLKATDSFSVLARAGLLSSPNVLWFGEAGWTHTNFNGDLDVPGLITASYDYDANGLTVGAGVEAKLTDKVSLKTDYRYTSYESKDIIPGILTADTNLQSVRSTISVRF